jgi:hypothetical protein
VRELLKTVDSLELAEWREYYAIVDEAEAQRFAAIYGQPGPRKRQPNMRGLHPPPARAL